MSSVGTAFGLIVLGVYVMLKPLHSEDETLNWIPVISFSWSAFATTLGIVPVSLVLVVEIMPERMKDACVSLCMALLWLFEFLNVRFSSSLVEKLGFHVALYVIAGLCLLCTVLIILFIPETNGKSHGKIMKSLQ